MSELLNKVGTLEQDNLIAHIEPRAHTMAVSIAAGAGNLVRGSVLARNPSGDFVLYGTKSGNSVIGEPSAVLTVDVDASGESAVAGVAYRTGCFNRDKLIFADEYEMTAADEDTLRKYGIILSVML